MAHEKYQNLITLLNECIQACEHCYDACFHEEHSGMMKKCIQTDRECSDICSLTLQAISRNSEFKDDLIALCAKVCEKCAEECEKHDHDHCQKCANACRRCAEVCKELVS